MTSAAAASIQAVSPALTAGAGAAATLDVSAGGCWATVLGVKRHPSAMATITLTIRRLPTVISPSPFEARGPVVAVRLLAEPTKPAPFSCPLPRAKQGARRTRRFLERNDNLLIGRGLRR